VVVEELLATAATTPATATPATIAVVVIVPAIAEVPPAAAPPGAAPLLAPPAVEAVSAANTLPETIIAKAKADKPEFFIA
jgi:hypothetical protein